MVVLIVGHYIKRKSDVELFMRNKKSSSDVFVDSLCYRALALWCGIILENDHVWKDEHRPPNPN